MSVRNFSLNGLRVFEAAARHLSFTAAAEELHVTQAAVSQQVRTLEKQLSLELFVREKRGLVLTENGQELAVTTSAALKSIQLTLDKISSAESDNGQALTLSTIPSFASRWLIPRLSDFQKNCSEIVLHIQSSNTVQDLMVGNVDAAIRWAATEQSGHRVESLMQDAVCLVCAPALAMILGDDPSNLTEQTLIVDGDPPLNRGKVQPTELDPEVILSNLSIGDRPPRMLMFNQSDNVVLSALAGQGVGVTRLSLCADELDAGRLKIVFGYCKPMTEGYSLVYPEYRSADRRLQEFRSWLLDLTSEFRSDMDEKTAELAAKYR
ncbi:MAG: LysR family transcriptional regulator [Gammaproteobacteria bacterium]|nr:LysR family transcriptional regulator [Gammaproteobacteria bacterium]